MATPNAKTLVYLINSQVFKHFAIGLLAQIVTPADTIVKLEIVTPALACGIYYPKVNMVLNLVSEGH